MKVTEVIFKRNYAISPLTHEHMHLGATVVVEENESPEEALKLAQKTVEDFYKEAMKQVRPSSYDMFNSIELPMPSIDYKEQEKKEVQSEYVTAFEDTVHLCKTREASIKILEKMKPVILGYNLNIETFQDLIDKKFS